LNLNKEYLKIYHGTILTHFSHHDVHRQVYR